MVRRPLPKYVLVSVRVYHTAQRDYIHFITMLNHSYWDNIAFFKHQELQCLV